MELASRRSRRVHRRAARRAEVAADGPGLPREPAALPGPRVRSPLPMVGGLQAALRYSTGPDLLRVEHRSHSADYEGRPARRSLTKPELQRLFDHADEQGRSRPHRRRKGWLAALRDSAASKVAYAWGLRRREPPEATATVNVYLSGGPFASSNRRCCSGKRHNDISRSSGGVMAVHNVVDPASVGMSAERLARIAPAMQGFVDRGVVRGISTLVARRGQVVHRGLYGHRDAEVAAAMTDDTIFRIYSMTKPIVSTGADAAPRGGPVPARPPGRSFPAGVRRAEGAAGRRVAGRPRSADADRRPADHTSGLTYDFMVDNPVAQLYRDAES